MRPQCRRRLSCQIRRQRPLTAEPNNDDGWDRIRNTQDAQLPYEAGIIACHGIEASALTEAQSSLFAFGRATVRLVHGDAVDRDILLDSHGVGQAWSMKPRNQHMDIFEIRIKNRTAIS